MEAEQKIICPKCNNEENLHLNYDYSKKVLSIIDIDVLCNECGNCFMVKNKKNINSKSKNIYPKKQ